MSSQRKLDVSLPVGERPRWELDQIETDKELNSISDSCILAQSLRQSKEQWLFRTFPKFSGKARVNKAAEAPAPPHTIQARGKCDLEIGPHIFPHTVFYEVHYLPMQPSISPYPHQGNPPSWQATTPYSASQVSYSQASASMNRQAVQTTGAAATVEKSTSPLISSLTTVTTITPALINQVNSAASSNPILSNLLQLAAAGRASPDQLKTLGLLIQSLAAAVDTPFPSTSYLPAQQVNPGIPATTSFPGSYHPTTSASPLKEFDVVVEFRETPSEKWILPRVPATCDKAQDNDDMVINIRVPFDKPQEPHASESSHQPDAVQIPIPQIASLRLKKAPATIWNTISRWIGGEEKIKANRKILDELQSTNRAFLGYQLPLGALLTQLQTISLQQFAMKPLKHGPSTIPARAPRQKRTYTQRKTGVDGKLQRKASTSNSIDTSDTRKRPRLSQSGSHNSQIRCISCSQTDVPLILGGRFCRPCVDNGKAIGTTVISSGAPGTSPLPTSSSIVVPSEEPVSSLA